MHQRDRRDVEATLYEQAFTLQDELERRWGGAHYRRRGIDVSAYEFPKSVEAMFDHVAVCLVTENDHERDEQRIVLVQDRDHAYPWELPGGAAEPGERPVETARREVTEETGIECRIEDLLVIELLEFDYGVPERAPVIQAVFTGCRTGGELAYDDEEILAVDWFRASDVPEGTQFGRRIQSYLTNTTFE